jgi:uncharacterized protein YndB with AHSA1/START domain
MEYKDRKKLVITRTFDAPIDLVWQAITDMELLHQWAPFFSGFRPEVGFESRFLLGSDEDHQYLHNCCVTEVIENQRLTYTWAYDQVEGESYVTFELSPVGKKTNMTFTHEITKPFPPDDPNFAPASFLQGWTSIVGTLQKFVESNPRG